MFISALGNLDEGPNRMLSIANRGLSGRLVLAEIPHLNVVIAGTP